MIKLHYLHEDPTQALGFRAYLLLQEENDCPFLILEEDEILGQIDLINGQWRNASDERLDEDFVNAVVRFISTQQFLHLPRMIKERWVTYIADVIVQTEASYLIVLKPKVDLLYFERLFSDYVPQLIRDEWEITFKVYDAAFNDGFELRVK